MPTVVEGSVPDFKVDDRRLLEWYINEINELKVNVRLNTEVTPDMVANEKPDEVVVATGSVPIILDIPGINRDNVVTASDLLLGKKKAGNTVVVLGGGLVGSETALWLAKQGKKVTIVEALSDIIRAGKYVPHMNRIMLIDLLKFHGVDIMTSAYLLEVTDGGAVVMRKDSGTRTTIPTDTVVLATGYRPDNALYRSLSGKIANLYLIGDARDPQNIMNAIWDAYEVAQNM
ncbi:MAG TPA: FAD-dependent oxidoreductase [Thermoanaerobacterales bacterium]|nr:FAD-dependent oxidoreductase [Thermoanaerobacterales bacterium]